MRLKKLNNWFIRVLLICFLALVYIGGWCEIDHPLNPNLKLVVGDTTTTLDSIHCSNPVVSPDGRTIYYLGIPLDSAWGIFSNYGIGAVYSIGVDGSNNKKILDGKYDKLAISHDAKSLSVLSLKGDYQNFAAESLILVIHLDKLNTGDGGVIDSFWITPKGIGKMEWSYDYETYST